MPDAALEAVGALPVWRHKKRMLLAALTSSEEEDEMSHFGPVEVGGRATAPSQLRSRSHSKSEQARVGTEDGAGGHGCSLGDAEALSGAPGPAEAADMEEDGARTSASGEGGVAGPREERCASSTGALNDSLKSHDHASDAVESNEVDAPEASQPVEARRMAAGSPEAQALARESRRELLSALAAHVAACHAARQPYIAGLVGWVLTQLLPAGSDDQKTSDGGGELACACAETLERAAGRVCAESVALD